MIRGSQNGEKVLAPRQQSADDSFISCLSSYQNSFKTGKWVVLKQFEIVHGSFCAFSSLMQKHRFKSIEVNDIVFWHLEAQVATGNRSLCGL